MAQHTTTGEWTTLTAHLPGRRSEPIGIVLRDTTSDELYVKMLDDWSDLVANEDSDIWREMEADLIKTGQERGGLAVLTWLESTMSQAIQIGPVHKIEVEQCSATLMELFDRYVSPMRRALGLGESA